MARLPLVAAGVGGSLACTTALRSAATTASAPVSGVVKLNQQGYLPGAAKHARLMTTQPVRGARFRVVDAQGSRYVDDVRSWQTDEPALDMTGAAIIAAATQLRLHPDVAVGR